MTKGNSFLIALLTLALLLAGCGAAMKDTISSRDDTVLPVKQAAPPIKAERKDDKAEKEAQNANITSYNISKGIYSVSDSLFNVTITYPQITNLGDVERQLAINEILKQRALRYGKYEIEPEMFTGEYKGFPKGFWARVDYEIKWQSENVLSVLYHGSNHFPRRPHPNHYLEGVNIDINKASVIELPDLVDFNTGFSFAEKFKEGKINFVRPWLAEKVIISNNAEPDRKGPVFDDVYLLERFSAPAGHFYLTKDSLGLTVPVSFALGDEVEFEIKYEDIAKHIKLENEVWKDFFPEQVGKR